MTEETALAVREQSALVTRQSPMDTLATMSDAEFEQRLQALKTAQKRMARIQREMMEKDTDYGVIPGTGDKPTLLKPGAERLCSFHKLVPTFQKVVTLGDGIDRPHIRVETDCYLHYLTDDGPIVGHGVGAANNWEKKYRWRDAQRLCPMCGQPTIFKSKQEAGGWFCWAKKGGCGAQFKGDDPSIINQVQGRVENPDPYDGENTLTKMSAKRAYIDATLRATATSGLFSQDLEDMEQEPAKPNGHTEPPAKPTQPPQKVTPKAEPVSAIEQNVDSLPAAPSPIDDDLAKKIADYGAGIDGASEPTEATKLINAVLKDATIPKTEQQRLQAQYSARMRQLVKA